MTRRPVRSSDLLLVAACLVALLAGLWFFRQAGGDGGRAVAPLPTSAAPTASSIEASSAPGQSNLPRALVVLGDDSAVAADVAPGAGWVDLVAADLHLRAVNLASAGAGYTVSSVPTPGCPVAPCASFTTLIDRVVAERPYLVMVVAGRHDLGADPAVAARSAGEVAVLLRQRLPTATIAFVEPFLADPGQRPQLLTVIPGLAEAVRTRTALWISGGQPFALTADTTPEDATPTSQHAIAARGVEESLAMAGVAKAN